jgi:chemotaxis protein methyltransferase CheR
MEVTEISYRIIADLLEARTGQQLTESRRWRIGTALSGVFRKHGITNVDQLVCMLADKGSERLAEEVVEALLNNETYFFRDRIMFELLGNRILPDLAEKRQHSKRLSIWSAGCSTGQEAYSLAMLFADQPSLWQGWTIDIVGTDISQQAIANARKATYNQFEIQRGLSVAQMLAHFSETPDGWQPSQELRNSVRFKVRNVLEEAPIRQKFDLVLCRNVLLYFDDRRRTTAFQRISSSLKDDGWLMLGAGESVLGRTRFFRSAEGHQGLYIHNPNGFRDRSADSEPFTSRRSPWTAEERSRRKPEINRSLG